MSVRVSVFGVILENTRPILSRKAAVWRVGSWPSGRCRTDSSWMTTPGRHLTDTHRTAEGSEFKYHNCQSCNHVVGCSLAGNRSPVLTRHLLGCLVTRQLLGVRLPNSRTMTAWRRARRLELNNSQRDITLTSGGRT